MNEKLARMEKDIRRKLNQSRGFAACILLLLIASVSGVIPVRLENPHLSDYMSGFQLGLLSGLLAVALFTIVRYQKALKDENRLKQLYYEEHDERNRYIHWKSGASAVNVSIILLLVAGVIAGYFNFTVFATLIASAVVTSIIRGGFKLYYCRSLKGTAE